MPQMAPLWWEILFLLFIMNFMMMSTIIYHNKMYSPKQMKMKYKINQFKWKW
nr:ATP synthase subunit 8 [Latimbus concolor]